MSLFSGEEIEITFSYWDGSGHRKTVKVKRDEYWKHIGIPRSLAQTIYSPWRLLSSCFYYVFVCISPADEEGQHHPELSAEGSGGPQEGLQWAQVRCRRRKSLNQKTLSLWMNERVHSVSLFLKPLITFGQRLPMILPVLHSLLLFERAGRWCYRTDSQGTDQTQDAIVNQCYFLAQHSLGKNLEVERL